MFLLILAGESCQMAGDLRRHDIHLMAIVMGEDLRYLNLCCGHFKNCQATNHGPFKLIVYKNQIPYLCAYRYVQYIQNSISVAKSDPG